MNNPPEPRGRQASQPGSGQNAAALVKLLTWLSPAFPTGAFAYSHALEWAVESGDITSEPTLLPWLQDTIQHGAGHTDAILLRHAHRATDAPTLAGLAELAAAASPCRERRAETLGQGDAFTIAARVWGAPLLDALRGPIAYPIAVGALARAHGVPEDPTTTAFLHAFASNLVGAAIRLVPLGQTAGLRTMAALEPTLHAITAATRHATLDDIGSACFRSDIAAMRHETQYTRLFRT